MGLERVMLSQARHLEWFRKLCQVTASHHTSQRCASQKQGDNVKPRSGQCSEAYFWDNRSVIQLLGGDLPAEELDVQAKGSLVIDAGARHSQGRCNRFQGGDLSWEVLT